ncbi:MAG TPA: L-histidine N(alpha)-methyltransferase [Methylophilaceae bacterium]|nr:L-histidine N(alpha)-methyltransferase [Methylophilaceae bacterium]
MQTNAQPNLHRDQYVALEPLTGFAEDVIHGLSQLQKTLPCKWFYDETGSQLFEAITRTPEYYLTRVETRLLRELVPQLAELMPDLSVVVEPGSGASIKTRLLLEGLPNLQKYVPMDISEDFLLDAADALKQDFPDLEIEPVVADFTQPLPSLTLEERRENLVFFPGSTIGNFAPAEAQQMLCNIHEYAGGLLIGVDMTQDRQKLLAAYNDTAGLTAQFNKNILLRANSELGANFDLDSFQHRAYFNEQLHRVEMHLESRRMQQVNVYEHRFYFAPGETIHTENCYKYTYADFKMFCQQCGWEIVHAWTDQQESDFGVFLLTSKR